MLVKKAQLKIQQMAFMLIAITLLFALAGMFVLVFMFSGLKESATALNERNALLLVSRLANSPEFSCGESFGMLKLNCVDQDKVLILKQNSKTYSGFWGIAGIEIQKIYPESLEECTLGNYPNCGLITIYSEKNKGVSSSNFISLCRKASSENGIYDKCEIAKLIIFPRSEQ